MKNKDLKNKLIRDLKNVIKCLQLEDDNFYNEDITKELFSVIRMYHPQFRDVCKEQLEELFEQIENNLEYEEVESYEEEFDKMFNDYYMDGTMNSDNYISMINCVIWNWKSDSLFSVACDDADFSNIDDDDYSYKQIVYVEAGTEYLYKKYLDSLNINLEDIPTRESIGKLIRRFE